MSTIEFVLISGLRVGKYYKLITFRNGIRMSDIQLGRTDKKYLDLSETLGKLLEIRQYGRSYDPDIDLVFEMPNGNVLEFVPTFGYSEAYIEYEPETEKLSKERIQERTSILKKEILGNDWALRPENVVATQGLDISRFAP
jgi:hypothetical protein